MWSMCADTKNTIIHPIREASVVPALFQEHSSDSFKHFPFFLQPAREEISKWIAESVSIMGQLSQNLASSQSGAKSERVEWFRYKSVTLKESVWKVCICNICAVLLLYCSICFAINTQSGVIWTFSSFTVDLNVCPRFANMNEQPNSIIFMKMYIILIKFILFEYSQCCFKGFKAVYMSLKIHPKENPWSN